MNWIALDTQGYAVAKYLLAVLWQSSLLFAGVAGIVLLVRHHAPRIRRALWLTALLIAPFLPLLSMLAKPSGLPQQEVAAFPTYTPPISMSPPIPHAPLPVIVPPQRPITPLPVPAPRPLDYPWAMALMAYALGSAGFLSWTLLGHLRIRQWIRSGKAPANTRVLEAFREAATRLKRHRRVHVVMTDRVGAPVTVGLFRATVLLPNEVTATLTDEDLLAVAIHETAHIRQHDPLFLTVASLVRGLLFFHPLVWVACRALAVLAEHVADDAVLEATGQPLPYAKLLTTLAERLPRRTPTVEGAAGLILCKSAFLRRVEAILGDRTRIRRLTCWTLAASLVGCLAVIGVALAVPLTQRETPDSKCDWKAGEVVSGLQVSISPSKTKFGYMEPIHIRSRIQNVSKEPKTIIWQDPPTSPMIFEVVKPDDMKHYFEDLSMKERLLSPNSLPEIRILQPGNFYETLADLRQVLNIDPHKTDGSFELRTLYSPRNASTMSYRIKKDSFQVPENVFMESVASPTVSFTLTDDLTWLKDQLASGHLDAAKKLVEPLGKDYVLAELEKLYSTKSLLDKLPLVDCMAQLGSTSHIKDILDVYDSGELLPPGTIYEECDVWIFLLKWGGNREQRHLVHFLQENLGHVYNTDNTAFSVDPFLVALVEGRDEMGNEFSLDKGAAPLMAMVLDVQKAKEHRHIKDTAGVEHDVTVRWCDEAAMMLQKVLQRDWGFTCDKPVKERDAIINHMRTEFADLVWMLSTEDPKADSRNPAHEEDLKAANIPQESLCQSLLTLDPNSTVARDGLARIPTRPGAENKQSTYKLSDSTITRAKDAAKAELDARKRPGHGLRDRRPAGLEKADSDAAIAQIIETSMTESVSNDESTRDAALRRLRYLGDRAFEALTNGLKSDNPNVRAVSASLLQECGTKATPLLSQALLNDSDITVRSAAALSLGNLFDPKGVPALLTALQDPIFEVNMNAIGALRLLRSREAFDPLRTLMDNPKANAQLREAAAKALRQIDPASGTKAVQEAFEKEKDESLRHNYQVVLNESPFDNDYWPPELLALRQLTKDAATLAGEQFGDAEITQLLAYIRSDNNTASNTCLLALGALRVESAVPAIIALGPQKNCVCPALAEMASPEAVAFLLDVLQSPNPDIRKAAIRALGEHAGRWAVPVLVDLLDDPGLRKKSGSSPDGMEWPDEHEAHAALWTCLSRSGLKNSILNLADSQGRTFNVDEEIKRTKVWWQEHGEDYLHGKSVPSPDVTAVWWVS